MDSIYLYFSKSLVYTLESTLSNFCDGKILHELPETFRQHTLHLDAKTIYVQKTKQKTMKYQRLSLNPQIVISIELSSLLLKSNQ